MAKTKPPAIQHERRPESIFHMCPPNLYDAASLDVMLDQLREANSEIVIGPERLREVLHELWIALGWIETTPYWQELEARDENLTPADHLDLAQRYEDLVRAADPFAPGLLNDLMRREINRLARQRSRHVRNYGQATLRQGTRLDDPPLLDRMAEDQDLMRTIAADLAQFHRSQGPARGRARDPDLDDALEQLARLYMDLAGLKIGLPELDRIGRQPFLRFADSALAPFERIERYNKSEALTKRWWRYLAENYQS